MQGYFQLIQRNWKAWHSYHIWMQTNRQNRQSIYTMDESKGQTPLKKQTQLFGVSRDNEFMSLKEVVKKNRLLVQA